MKKVKIVNRVIILYGIVSDINNDECLPSNDKFDKNCKYERSYFKRGSPSVRPLELNFLGPVMIMT